MTFTFFSPVVPLMILSIVHSISSILSQLWWLTYLFSSNIATETRFATTNNLDITSLKATLFTFSYSVLALRTNSVRTWPMFNIWYSSKTPDYQVVKSYYHLSWNTKTGSQQGHFENCRIFLKYVKMEIVLLMVQNGRFLFPKWAKIRIWEI